VTGAGAPRHRGLPAKPLADALVAAGTELLFGVPGGGSNLDVSGAAEAAGCRFVLAHGETAAGIMAGVTGELTGRPGACVVTRGPGAASAVNAVAQAWLDRQPMVLLTDCVTSGDAARVSHQRLDHQALFGGITKASVRCPADDGRLPDLLALTVEGRPGPVHVDLDPDAPPTTSQSSPAAETHETVDLDVLRAALRSARRPVVVAGVGTIAVPAGRRDALQEALHRFLAEAPVAVLTTYKARGVISDLDPRAAGVATGGTIESAVLASADLIIGVGLDPVELIPAPWPYPAPVVLLGAWANDDSTFFGDRVAHEVTGDLAGTLEALAGSLAPDPEPVPAQRSRSLALERLQAAEPPSPAGVDERVVCFTGDGGLGMVLAELETLARLQLDVLVVVFNDSTLSLIAIKQRSEGQGGTGAVRYRSTDYAAVARGCGLAAETVRDEAALKRAVLAACGRRGPALLDVTVDPSGYGAVLEAIRGTRTTTAS